MKRTAVTLGSPNGISPEIAIKALNGLNPPAESIILIGNNDILKYYAGEYGLCLNKEYEIINIPFDIKTLKTGFETKDGGEFSFQALKKACMQAKEGIVNSIVTAPVSKNEMRLAGHNYSGQTEVLEHYLAEGNQKAEMVFACRKFCVMLMTRHIALSSVSSFIKKEQLVNRIEKLAECLEKQLGINKPSIAVCALNPHAGENGMFGNEEINEINPAVKELQSRGINIEGAFPADALFAHLNPDNPEYSCYIAMYHDQGLIPVKMLESSCVNVSLGLKALRTSPAHGTAFDIAGKNKADAGSMINALKLALK